MEQSQSHDFTWSHPQGMFSADTGNQHKPDLETGDLPKAFDLCLKGNFFATNLQTTMSLSLCDRESLKTPLDRTPSIHLPEHPEHITGTGTGGNVCRDFSHNTREKSQGPLPSLDLSPLPMCSEIILSALGPLLNLLTPKRHLMHGREKQRAVSTWSKK